MDFTIFFIYSLPEMFAIVALALVLCGYKPTTIKYVAASSLIACANLLIQVADLSMAYRIVLQFILALVILELFFRLPIRHMLFAMFLSLLLLQIVQAITLQIVVELTGMPFSQLKANSLLISVLGWPALVFMWLIVYLIKKSNFILFKKSIHKQSRLRLFVGFSLTVLLYMLGILGTEFITTGSVEKNKNLVIVIVFELVFLALVREIIRADRNEIEMKIQQEYIASVNSLFTTIRAQRHDFVNHIQVLSFFLHQKKYDQAKEYLEQLSGKIKAISQVLVSGNAGLSALLQTKTALLNQEGIKLVLDIHSNLTEVTMSGVEVNQVIGNLVNNAADAIRGDDYRTPEIHLQTGVEGTEVYIRVSNFRPIIPENLQEKIFDYGFSTKNDHSGIGLAIVKELVIAYNGKVMLTSNESTGTIFTVFLPFKEKKRENI